ncbi:YibE/F family protein [Lentzea sp. BCCO 10_0856]|uniref:YibE/F family protein n=1 Tax=Lentzea miocenica TaxID=3095431 RepID=A0ABU4T4R0_9PSEU|nr:YibE/F family protein [Lentzea sp. BCCO 10_0856]MDX8033153.1 YibE/F family protein [Lentzea sp. BCCO 10_0856]
MGHGHGHSHALKDEEPASERVRTLLMWLLVPLALATIVGAALLYPFGHEQKTGAEIGLHQKPVNAVVTGEQANCGEKCVAITVRMTDGDASGQSITIPSVNGPGAPRFNVGDEVVLSYSGSQPQAAESYQIVDFQRGWSLVVLALLFAAAVLLLGRWQGFAALGALLLSFVVLVLFVMPSILAGKSPLMVAVVGAGLIMFVVLYLTHGISARTSTAVLGTLVSLALIGVLGALFSAVASLTGLDEDTINLVTVLGTDIDTRGLLLAGTLIGALGVLDDVTVTQTSAVWELRRANDKLTWRDLFAAGSRIGRDHMSSVVNTLVMAYAGAALPLLLAISLAGRSMGEILTAQQIAQEIVRTLVGSIGLVAAIPVTTALAALVAVRQEVAPAAAPKPEPDPEPEPKTKTVKRAKPEPPRRQRIEGDLYIGYDPDKGPWERPGASPRAARRAAPARQAPPARRRSSGSP